MHPALVFFVVAALIGGLIRAVVAFRRRAVARRHNVSDEDLCAIDQAKRISTTAVAASLAGAAVVALIAQRWR